MVWPYCTHLLDTHGNSDEHKFVQRGCGGGSKADPSGSVRISKQKGGNQINPHKGHSVKPSEQLPTPRVSRLLCLWSYFPFAVLNKNLPTSPALTLYWSHDWIVSLEKTRVGEFHNPLPMKSTIVSQGENFKCSETKAGPGIITIIRGSHDRSKHCVRDQGNSGREVSHGHLMPSWREACKKEVNW